MYLQIFTDIYKKKKQLYIISLRLARFGTYTYYFNRNTTKNHRRCLNIAKAAKREEKVAQRATIAHLGPSKNVWRHHLRCLKTSHSELETVIKN